MAKNVVLKDADGNELNLIKHKATINLEEKTPSNIELPNGAIIRNKIYLINVENLTNASVSTFILSTFSTIEGIDDFRCLGSLVDDNTGDHAIASLSVNLFASPNKLDFYFIEDASFSAEGYVVSIYEI